MTILNVLKDKQAMQELEAIQSSLLPDSTFLCYDNGLPALAAARTKEVDLAFLDTDLPELSGLDLGQYLQDLYPLINLIYLSENTDKCFSAIQQHASGYLLKSNVEKNTVLHEVEDLRHPTVQKQEKRLFAQTFGNFELFVDKKPIAFKYSRTKEIVALLINNRGAQTTNGEIIACLWEDEGDADKKTSYLSNLRQDLQNTFSRLKLNGIILKQRGSLAIATDRIECDLYDWLENKQESRYHYLGDYMSQYSWPEVMHAELDEISWSFDE